MDNCTYFFKVNAKRNVMKAGKLLEIEIREEMEILLHQQNIYLSIKLIYNKGVKE